MTTQEFIIELFCLVDDQMPNLPKHPQAHLWPSELTTIGLLYALKGGSFQAFYRWLKRDYESLFGTLPERSRLERLLRTHQGQAAGFLADPSFFTVVDTYGIELIHPWREGRSPQQVGRQVGRQGKSNRRWIVGIKLCWLLNARGEVVAWAWNTANVHDQQFHGVVEPLHEQTITLADSGFRCKAGIPDNLKLCARGTWGERQLIETVLSLVTRVCHLKHLTQRVAAGITARLAYVPALFNVLLQLNRQQHPQAAPEELLHIAQYAL